MPAEEVLTLIVFFDVIKAEIEVIGEASVFGSFISAKHLDSRESRSARQFPFYPVCNLANLL